MGGERVSVQFKAAHLNEGTRETRFVKGERQELLKYWSPKESNQIEKKTLTGGGIRLLGDVTKKVLIRPTPRVFPRKGMSGREGTNGLGSPGTTDGKRRKEFGLACLYTAEKRQEKKSNVGVRERR